jgi:integrase
MASIHKDSQGRSPYFYCAYYGADGRRMLRSTKETDRKVALNVCNLWEEAGKKARRHELTAAAGRKVIAEMVAISSGEQLEFHSVEGWIRSWLAGKKGSTAKATFTKYEQLTGDFLAHLGARARAPLASVSPTDIAAFRDKLRAEGRSVSTCNIARNVVSIPFAAAVRQGLLAHNPCLAVDNLRSSNGAGLAREAFSPQEVALLVAEASGGWKGAVILAATSGLRLGDVAKLRWEAVDLEAGLLHIETQKTGEVVVLPIHPDFAHWLSAQSERGIGKAYVFPGLADTGTSGAQGLSRQFRAIMEKAGITERIVGADGGKGRARSSKGFHSLCHTFVSQLANSGVVSEIRQKLVGHTDSGVHKKYTHHELAVLRDAVAKLPSCAGPKASLAVFKAPLLNEEFSIAPGGCEEAPLGA